MGYMAGEPDESSYDIGLDLDGDPLLQNSLSSDQSSSGGSATGQPSSQSRSFWDHESVPTSLNSEVGIMRKQLDTIFQLLDQPDRQYSCRDREEWTSELLLDLPNPADFRAGRLRAHAPVLKEYFRLTGSESAAAKRVARWLTDGITWPFVDINHPDQQAAPMHRKKIMVTRLMLQRSLPKGTDIEPYMQGSRPQPVAFQNHRSTETYESFATSEIQGMLRKGVIKEWAASEPPVVVNGLRVVDDKPKLRLCLNPMYLNQFLQYQPVKYERLSDLVPLAEEGDFACTTDDKSGYWQCPLHQSMWAYLAFRFKGRLYCFTHLPFGVAPACYIYTAIKQEIFRPLRERGLRMLYLIDDQFTMQPGEARTQVMSAAMARLLASLGFTLSLEKCQLYPAQLLRFLGLLVDLKARAFRIPADKMQQLAELIADCQQAAVMSDRLVAKVAGKVMALSQAMVLAPLVARDMWKTAQGGGWDQAYPSPEAFTAAAELLMELMARSNGKSWAMRTQFIQVVGDASESALSAYTPNGELHHPVVVPFTEAQLQAVARNDWSSTARELCVLPAVLRTIEEQRPGLLTGKRLQYCTDSQPAMEDLMRMKGNKNTFPIVRETLLFCDSIDAELETVWRPRAHPEQQQADAYSKVEDSNDWSLHPELYKSIIGHSSLEGRIPTLDVFASAANTKVLGAYYARYLAPGCKGVDAFAHRWDMDEATGKRHMAFVNGPFDQMGRILRQILHQKVDCIVVAPAWPRPWAALWRQLPVRASQRIPHRDDMFLPGALVPAEGRRPKAPRYAVWVYFVVW